MIRRRRVSDRLDVARPLLAPVLDHEPDAVDAAPDDERPAGAVPEPADQHRQHQVAVRDDRPLAVASKWDVEVVTEPARQRHVPAAPEVLERHGGVRRVEVLWELEPEQEREPDRDVRVAREVGVDLHRVRVDPDQDLERRVLAGRAEDLVDDVGCEVVRDHHLLEQPGRDQVEGAARVDAPRIARDVELRNQLPGPDDRPGHEVREEGEVHRELLERRRHEVAAVGVDDVADRHERVEGDADREDDRAQRDREVEPDDRRHVLRRADEEVVVLEVREHAEVADQGHGQERLALRLRRGAVDADCEELVPERAAGEQEDEPPVPPAVEDVAGDDDERPPAVHLRHCEPREREDDQEEDRKRGSREQHRRSLVCCRRSTEPNLCRFRDQPTSTEEGRGHGEP